ncbi:MAG: hypothetical protein AAF483_30345, partial [Planctomycetota bacterium]
QRETADVVDAIESSTSQVVEGTRRVDEAKQSLARMVGESRSITSGLLRRMKILTRRKSLAFSSHEMWWT